MKKTIDRAWKLFEALSNLALAAAFLLAWAGMPIVHAGARTLAYVIALEFTIMMFSFPILMFTVGPMSRELRLSVNGKAFIPFVGLLAVIMVFLGAHYSTKAGAAWPLINVLRILTGYALLFFAPPRTEGEEQRIIGYAVARITILFFLLMPCLVIPVPNWGAPGSMEGFTARPSGLLVWGALYYGIFGFYGHRMVAVDEPSGRGIGQEQA